MVLVDSSVWIDHIRKPDVELIDLLTANHVLMHPFVIGEILLGSVANRLELAATLDGLPKVRPAKSASANSKISVCLLKFYLAFSINRRNLFYVFSVTGSDPPIKYL